MNNKLISVQYLLNYAFTFCILMYRHWILYLSYWAIGSFRNIISNKSICLGRKIFPKKPPGHMNWTLQLISNDWLEHTVASSKVFRLCSRQHIRIFHSGEQRPWAMSSNLPITFNPARDPAVTSCTASSTKSCWSSAIQPRPHPSSTSGRDAASTAAVGGLRIRNKSWARHKR